MLGTISAHGLSTDLGFSENSKTRCRGLRLAFYLATYGFFSLVSFPLLGVQVGLAQELTKTDGSVPKLTKQETQYFESRIRPILANKCYACHSVDSGEAEGGLRLDSREAMHRGGNSGPAIVSKNPAQSLLIKAIEHQDSNLRMPPKSAGGKLSD